MTNANQNRVDYRVGLDGSLKRTEGAVAQMERYWELQKVAKLVDAAYCGALIASLFKKYEWLASFKLELEASAESDDCGGSSRSISLRVSDVKPVDGVSWHEEVSDDNELHEDRASDELEQELEDSNGDIYCSLVPEGGFSDLSLTFERKSVADMLVEPEISGRDAFTKLFPEYADLVTELGDRF